MKLGDSRYTEQGCRRDGPAFLATFQRQFSMLFADGGKRRCPTKVRQKLTWFNGLLQSSFGLRVSTIIGRRTATQPIPSYNQRKFSNFRGGEFRRPEEESPRSTKNT